jgi:hypothetical protein
MPSGPERRLLKPGVPLELIASARRRVALGFVIYVVATGLALVNAYLGLGISTAMWVLGGLGLPDAKPPRTMGGRWVKRGDNVDSEE